MKWFYILGYSWILDVKCSMNTIDNCYYTVQISQMELGRASMMAKCVLRYCPTPINYTKTINVIGE